jgi:ribosomal protein L35AE/L33A
MTSYKGKQKKAQRGTVPCRFHGNNGNVPCKICAQLGGKK